jgi:hypothetical protein
LKNPNLQWWPDDGHKFGLDKIIQFHPNLQWWPDAGHKFRLDKIIQFLETICEEDWQYTKGLGCIELVVSQLKTDPALLVKWKLLGDKETALEILRAGLE